ncbi:SRPBCC family protein [Catellatospora sp. NPDC049111]|uniref:SRPBCC family protein n=1 Tax=Catellatospora aurea TaxID=1337874 RepID=A0ABW2GZV1_9ACTN
MAAQSAGVRIAVEIVVDRPVAQVFAYLSDVRNDQQWWSGIHSSRRIGDGGVGTFYELDATLLRVRHQTRIEVTAQDPPYRQTITVRSGPLPYVAHYEWSPLTPDRTRFNLVAEIAAARPWARFGPLLNPLLSLLARRYFRRVPALIESATAP